MATATAIAPTSDCSDGACQQCQCAASNATELEPQSARDRRWCRWRTALESWTRHEGVLEIDVEPDTVVAGNDGSGHSRS
jgi:hypothetical protein